MTERAPHRARRPLTLGRVKAFVRRYVVGITTTWGVAFDLVFIAAVIAGILALILESVPEIRAHSGDALRATELVVGVTFVVEYLLRLWVAGRRIAYVTSFWGVVDLLAIVPFLFQGFGFAYLRVLRILRIFSILKVAHYTTAAASLTESLIASRNKITVFLLTVVVLVTVLGFTMNLVEPETFPTVPEAIWWTVVTITTVGFGDYVPHTLLGKVIASLAMITAFGIIAVPTGIVAAEIGESRRTRVRPRLPCTRCGLPDHVVDARYCSRCGERLSDAGVGAAT